MSAQKSFYGSQSGLLKSVAWVPGMPHIALAPTANAHYQKMNASVAQIGKYFAQLGVERVVFYSTQWISVLGALVQSKPEISGIHVDENWYELGDLHYKFNVDSDFASVLRSRFESMGQQTALVNYNGFPIDTGTIVASNLLGVKNCKSNMVSCHVYADFNQTLEMGRWVRQAIDESGIPTAVVGVSLMSQGFRRDIIELKEDGVIDAELLSADQRMIEYWKTGRHDLAREWSPAYAKQAKADMGFKAYAFLLGVMGEDSYRRNSDVMAYGSIYGAGGCVALF
jgi:2-aminophenol/2-amino-5-chlorophenol 1,6-dioxygenase subunit alpha